MTAQTYQRARRPEQKLGRRAAILGAARELALRDGVRAVSLADIATEVGIHKSALLRYFETREQIFLELTARSWREWAGAIADALDRIAPGDGGAVAGGAAGDAEAAGRASGDPARGASGDPEAVAAALADGF